MISAPWYLLGAVLVVLEVLDGVSWLLDISVMVILLDRGGTLGVRVLSVNDLHGFMSMSISTSMPDLRNSIATGCCCVSIISVRLVPTFHRRFGGDKAQKGAKDLQILITLMETLTVAADCPRRIIGHTTSHKIHYLPYEQDL
jgi:hypothetical protein